MHDLTSDSWFAPNIEPPYVGLLFSARAGTDATRRAKFVADIYRLAARTPGFIGVEGAGSSSGHLMSAIYWRDRASLDQWLAAAERSYPPPDARRESPRIYDFFTIRLVTVEETESGCLPPLHEPGA